MQRIPIPEQIREKVRGIMERRERREKRERRAGWIDSIVVIASVSFACALAFTAVVTGNPEPSNEIIIVDDGARHHASIPDSASEFECVLGRYRVRVEVLGEKP